MRPSLSLLQRRQTANILADDVELEVHECALLYAAEVGVLECVGNYRHRESVVGRLADRQRHAVDRHAALVHSDVALALELRRHIVLEREDVAAVLVGHAGADRRRDHVSLHDVSVQTSVHAHAALQIHKVTLLQRAQIAPHERFLNRRHGI